MDSKNDDVEIAEVKVNKGGRKKKPPSNSTYEEYKKQDVCFFISIVEQSRSIWDSTNAFYHRNDVKARSYDSLEIECTHFMARGKTHGKSAEYLWKSLTAEYQKERSKPTKSPSGSGTTPCSFPFMTELSFLEEDRSNRQVKNTYILGGGKNNTMEMETEDQPTPKRKKPNQLEDFLNGMEETNRMLCQALKTVGEDDRTNPEMKMNRCSNERICKIIDNSLRDLSDVGKIIAENKIINYVLSLNKPEKQLSDMPLSYYNNSADDDAFSVYR